MHLDSVTIDFVHYWDDRFFAYNNKFVALYSDYGETGLERPKQAD